MQDFQYRHDTRQVFNDFLTLTICAFGPDYQTGKSVDEELYLSTIERYKQDRLCDKFPELLALLITAMEERLGSDEGNDVLGEFYQEHLYVKGKSQYFTPWPICRFMAAITISDVEEKPDGEAIRILDPACGSGRMLLAGAWERKQRFECYGIDLDCTCVQMAALNLFLNGFFQSEVMCADALNPDDFSVSYGISRFGIYRVKQKEESRLWNMHRNSFFKESTEAEMPEMELVPSGVDQSKLSQLKLF